jgi:pimeloyl-[acyl-carrier protein] methyl ester esterase
MTLHVDVAGEGEPLVVLHGWGMHGGLLADIATLLAHDYQVHLVDLPGHGASAPLEAFTLDGVVEQLASRFARPVAVCGWSLGGAIALHWALRKPENVRCLALVSSTPCFTTRSDWPFGMDEATLLRFAADLETNLASTLRRFIGLQLRGVDGEKELLAEMRNRAFSRGEPDMATLRGGLAILRDTDFRDLLPGVRQRTLVIAGERDKLSPPEASKALAQALPHSGLVIVQGAGHAPFISHREEFGRYVREFLKEALS